MRRLVLTTVVAALLALGAKAPDPACEIVGGQLHGWNMPTRDELGASVDPYPVMGFHAPTGEFTYPWPFPRAYVWERGGGKSLIDMPRRLGDYHVIAICAA